MTGFAFVVLTHLGLLDAARIERRDMGELNRFAAEAVLILGETLFTERLAALNRDRYAALEAAAEADARKNFPEVDGIVKEYRRLTESYERTFAMQRELAREKLRDTLSRGTGGSLPAPSQPSHQSLP